MHNILVTRRLPQPALDLLKKHCDTMDMNPHDRPMTRQELLEGVRGRDGVLCLLNDSIDAAVFEAARGAKIFANHAVGFNNVDVKAATAAGIMVTNTPGVLTDTTADLTWALILSIARRIVECDTFTRQGKFKGWGPLLLLGTDVYGKTLGIVGAGRIGTAVAKRAAGFSMNILYVDDVPNTEMEQSLGAQKVDMDQCLKESDFITLHVPLMDSTVHMIGEKELGMMKSSTYLINTCRGPVVHEKALVNALDKKVIAGAALDVFEREPELEPGLAALDNVIVVPHIGSATVETRTKMAMMAAENLLAGLKGERPPNLINPEVLDL